MVVFAAAPTTLAGYVAGRRLSDRLGRKPVTAGSVVVFGLGALLVFTRSGPSMRWASSCSPEPMRRWRPPRTAFVSELFPTEVRATVASFVAAVNVAAGSLGLALVGLFAHIVEPSTSVIAMALACTATVVVLRRLPETAGIDVLGTPERP